MSTPIIYPPTQDGLQKTLDAALLTGVTASATLNNVTGIQNLKGLMVIDRVDGNNNLTPSKREYIIFTGTSGSTVVTLVRGLAGSTDQDHAVGAIVEFINDVVQQQAIIDGLLLTVTTAGELNKATGATINTGTDDATIVTPKALADAGVNTRLKSKIIIFNRNASAAGADVAYTGVGFQPTSLSATMTISGSTIMSVVNVDSFGTSGGISCSANNVFRDSTDLITYSNAVDTAQKAVLKSYDADGFTLTWSRLGSPTGTMTCRVLCQR